MEKEISLWAEYKKSIQDENRKLIKGWSDCHHEQMTKWKKRQEERENRIKVLVEKEEKIYQEKLRHYSSHSWIIKIFTEEPFRREVRDFQRCVDFPPMFTTPPFIEATYAGFMDWKLKSKHKQNGKK